jgi:hypothetical protein
MNGTKLLLNAYYEALYEQLCRQRDSVAERIGLLLQSEIDKRGFAELIPEKRQAYYDAAEAFIEERIEMYNPVGIQYTFDRRNSKFARELETKLSWYDSAAEFEALRAAAMEKSQSAMTEEDLQRTARELINDFGAFPDRSIVAAYEADPLLNKLPDYIAAQAIEQIIRQH